MSFWPLLAMSYSRQLQAVAQHLSQKRPACELEGRELAADKVKSFGSDAPIQLQQDDQEGQEGQCCCQGMHGLGYALQLVLLQPGT